MSGFQGWIFILIPALPIAYYAFVRPSLRIELDGFRIYRGLIRGRKQEFRSIGALQLERREWQNTVYYRLLIDIGGRTVCGGDEDDFRTLKLTLERLCTVTLEDEAAAAKLGIQADYGADPAPIGRKYYCTWGPRQVP